MSERFLVTFPGLYRVLGRLFGRLSPSGRLRRWILRWQLLSAWAAPVRNDYDLLAVRYAKDIVYEYNPELVTLGLPERVEGWEAWRRAIDQFVSAFDETRYELNFIFDFGERLLTLGRAFFRGQASGAEIEFDYCQLIELRGAQAVHERDFTHWDMAMSAAGLDPELLGRLKELPPRGVLELD